MDASMIPFDQDAIREVQKRGEIITSVISYIEKRGYKKLELQILYEDGSRKYFVLKDNGIYIEKREVVIQMPTDRKSRNKEICRLYYKNKLTQEFIGKIYGLSQPTISNIVNEWL